MSAPSSTLVRSLLLLLALCLLPAPAAADDPPIGSASTPTIDADSSGELDRRIRERLEAIYAEIEPLQAVDVSVASGVVRLSGPVDRQVTAERAERLALQVEGVVDIENELTLNRALEDRLESTGNRVVELLRQVLAGLPLLGVALAVFLLFWLAGRWVGGRRRLYRRIAPNVFIASLLGQVTHLGFIFLGLVLALALLDATALLGTILGAAGIVGLALGFAVRDTVENYIASILLSLRNPFGVNDLVDVDGQLGNVVTLTSRATILLSPEGNHVRIPNAAVYKAVIVNYSRRPERRFEFDVGVDTDVDLLAAQQRALDTLLATPGVLAEPAPLVVVQALGDSNVVLRCFGWVDQTEHSFVKVNSEAIRRVKDAFDEAGIGMPEPTHRVRIVERADAAAGDDRKRPRPSPTNAGVDVSVDRSLEDRALADAQDDERQNLLSPEADREG